MIETWVVLGLSGAFVIGLFNIYQKYLIEDGHDPINIILDMHMVASIALCSVAFIFVLIVISGPMVIILVLTSSSA